MLLGELLRDLQDEKFAMQILVEMNDVALLARLRSAADASGETPGELATSATRLFVNQANDEDWLSLMTAIENSDDAGRACLSRMIDWALRFDAASGAEASCSHHGPAHAGGAP